MIRVLHVISSIGNPGGVQSLIWNYYNNIDENEIRFDFVVFNKEKNGFENKFLNKKSKIYYVLPKRKGLLKHIKELDAAMKSEKYDIVHCHQDFLGYITMFLAWKNKIKTRIIHSHKANLEESRIDHIKRRLFTRLTVLFANKLFACGKDAAIWTYGIKKYRQDKVYVLNNAINTELYSYDSGKRLKIREELRISNYTVLGNVARFTYQKNHELLIRIFSKLVKNDSNYKLLLVGDGKDFEKIKKLVKEYRISDSVLFLGNRNDVADLLQAMDIFILTSRFEGLPVTLVEAQCSGLSCVVTDTITKEINVTGKIYYIGSNNYDDWIEKIHELKGTLRSKSTDVVKRNGYDIYTEVNKLCKIYRSCVKKR